MSYFCACRASVNPGLNLYVSMILTQSEWHISCDLVPASVIFPKNSVEGNRLTSCFIILSGWKKGGLNQLIGANLSGKCDSEIWSL